MFRFKRKLICDTIIKHFRSSSIIQCYAQMNQKRMMKKNSTSHSSVFLANKTKNRDLTIVKEGFNAKIGSNNNGQVMGVHGIGVMNENGENSQTNNKIVIVGSLYHMQTDS